MSKMTSIKKGLMIQEEESDQKGRLECKQKNMLTWKREDFDWTKRPWSKKQLVIEEEKKAVNTRNKRWRTR